MTFSDSVASTIDNSDITVSDDNNLGLSFAWQDSPNGQGMILVNRNKHYFTSDVDNLEQSIETVYAHFNGVAQFRQQHYVTTVSLGLGAAYVKSNRNSATYPSLTAAIGTRYEFSRTLAFVTEARMYGSLTKNNDTLFCNSSACQAQFSNSIWLETSLSAGLAFKF
jgi:hypothetical protein